MAPCRSNLYLLIFDNASNSGKINFNEFEVMLKRIRRLFPTAQIHIEKVRDVFEKYDADKDGTISTNELAEMFSKLSNSMTALPAVRHVQTMFAPYQN